MAEPRDIGIINGKKTFIPLENNPEILSHLAQSLGANKSVKFHDIYTLADVSHIPRPAHALIFTCASTTYYRARAAELQVDEAAVTTSIDVSGIEEAASSDAEAVVWYKQTIGHACGLYSTIHALSNGALRSSLIPRSTLENLLEATAPLRPADRANRVYDSQELEDAHKAAARQGDSAPPDPSEPNYNHFITFVKGNDGKLWELEGAWTGPIDRGQLEQGDDVLSERALDMGVRKFLDKAEGDLDFSLVAITGE